MASKICLLVKSQLDEVEGGDVLEGEGSVDNIFSDS